MASIIVFFLLFILPFIIAHFGVTQFENPKVIFGEFGIVVLFLVVVFTNNVSFRGRLKQLVIFSAMIVVSIIDLFFFRTNLSFFGNAFRMQGIFLLWMLLLFSFLSANVSFPKVPWWVYSLLLYIELIVTFFLPLNASQRYVGTLGEPNALAAFAIFVWPFGWFGIKHTKSEMMSKILLLVPVSILLFLSGSRSGMIAFGIELLFIRLSTWSFFVNREEKTVSHVLSIKTCVVVFLLVYLVSYAFPFFEHTPYENRVEVWQSAFYAGIINPVLGQGFGNTEIALHNTAAGLDLPVQYYYVDSSHNIFLDWWVQGGVIGISVLIVLVYTALSSFVKREKKQELVLLFGILTVLSFNPASVVGLLGFWWMIGRGLLEPI